MKYRATSPKGSSVKIICTVLMLFYFIPFSVFGAADTAALKKADVKTILQIGKTIFQSQKPQQSKILDYRIEEIAPTEGQSYKPENQIIQQDYRVSVLISYPKDFLLQRPTDNTPLILFADGFPLNGIKTEYFSQIRKNDLLDTTKRWPDKMWIPFLFKRDSTTKNAWNSLFHLAKWSDHEITFNLSLGWSGMFPLENAPQIANGGKATVIFYEPWVFWVLLGCYVLFIIGFILLSYFTGLIRDPDNTINTVVTPAVDQNTPPKLTMFSKSFWKVPTGPFSLSQTQLAFWTIIVIGGFVYLVLITGLTDCLNSSILLLIGISGGTTGTASFIDYYKKQQSSSSANQAMVPKLHRTFLLDILSDGVNVSMQRTQTVLWNFVLGIYFLWYVISNKSMPEFSSTLLVLTGVSSALYVTSKGPENTPVKPA